MWVRKGRALAPPCTVCSIGVSTSRKPRRSSVVRTARSTADRAASRRRASAFMIQVEVTPAGPGASGVGQSAPLVGQRTQRLGRQFPTRDQHRQFAAPRSSDLSVCSEVVTQIHVVAQPVEVGATHGVGAEQQLRVPAPVTQDDEDHPRRGRVRPAPDPATCAAVPGCSWLAVVPARNDGG